MMTTTIVTGNDALAQGDLADGRVERQTTASVTAMCLTGNGLRGEMKRFRHSFHNSTK
jgi:hypothetical protein